MPDNTFDINGGNNQIAPNATEANQNFPGNVQNLTIINGGRNATRAANLTLLHQEIGKQVPEPTKEAVRFYETKIPGTKDVEQKLTDGGFNPVRIREAVRLKQFWGKEALRTSDYPVIQEENLQIYSRISHEFNIYIMPMVEDGAPLRDIMKELHERIVSPIMNLFQEHGYSDENLRYTYDHIYGIIYYLTGQCHLNWAHYDDNL